MYCDAQAAALYDVLNRWAADDDHYARLAAGASSVLDVGCGTGRLLTGVRAAGHGGRLVGLDPDRAALDVARRTGGVEWVEGSAGSMTWRGGFALAAMTSHAFQCLVSDEEVATSVLAVQADVVTLRETLLDDRGAVLRVDEARLCFLPPDALRDALAAAGFSVRTWHGDFTGGPFRDDSAEIVVVAA